MNMYSPIYEITCTITSGVMIITSTYILIKTSNFIIIFIMLAGITSFLTRLYRIIKKEYVMDHPLVYTDIIYAITAFVSFIFFPFDKRVYYPVISSFVLMIIAAIMSWNIFPIHLVNESFLFQSMGHIIISSTLLYYVVFFIE